MVYRESSEMVRLLAGAGGVLAGLALVLAAAALYYRYKRKNAAMKGCALRMLFFVLAALPVFVVPLLAYASENGNGSQWERERQGIEEENFSESEAESGTDSETESETQSGKESETESREESETESRKESETETESESDSETESETESEKDKPTETETQSPELEEQELLKALKNAEWRFLDDSGKKLRCKDDVLLTGGRVSRPDQIHLQICMKSPAIEKAIGKEGTILFQVFGGPETWRREVQRSFRETKDWKMGKSGAVWDVSFAEDGSYLIQIGISRGEKAVPLICCEKTVIVDTTAPEIEAEGLPENGLFSRKDCALQVYVKDANPDGKAVPKVETKGLHADFSGWTIKENGMSGELMLKGEGSASFSLTARDLAGNLSAPYRSGQVVIDKTPPGLWIEPPAGKQSGSVIYVSSAPEIVIGASDPYFDGSESGVTVNADGGSWHAGSWKQEGSQWKMHVQLEGDGSYSILAKGRDYAGNETLQELGQKIVVDTAAPLIRMAGAEDGISYRIPLSLEVEAEDSSLSAGKLHIQLLNQLNGREIEKTITAGNSTVSWKQEAAQDGIYILQMHAEDGAGNLREEEVRFRINAAGSKIEPDESTANILLSGFMKTASPLVFTEYNIDKLQERRLLLNGGSPRVLKEGTDYHVKETIEKNGLHSYRYEISEACFGEEGYYTLHMYSKDAAGNEYAGGQSKALFRFAADYQAPVITVTGLEDGAVYQDHSPVFTVSASDAVGMSLLRVFVNDRVVLERDAWEIRKAGGIFSMTLDPSQYVQEIRVEALDAAGRSAAPQVFRVLVPEEIRKLSEKEEKFVKEAAAESMASPSETEVYGAADMITDAMGGLEKKVETKEERIFLIAAVLAIAGIGIAGFLIAIRKRKGEYLSEEDTSS